MVNGTVEEVSIWPQQKKKEEGFRERPLAPESLENAKSARKNCSRPGGGKKEQITPKAIERRSTRSTSGLPTMRSIGFHMEKSDISCSIRDSEYASS